MGFQHSQDSYQTFPRNPAECLHFNTLRVDQVILCVKSTHPMFESRVRCLEQAHPVLIKLCSMSILTNFGSSIVRTRISNTPRV